MCVCTGRPAQVLSAYHHTYRSTEVRMIGVVVEPGSQPACTGQAAVHHAVLVVLAFAEATGGEALPASMSAS
jgi:hypothetical protein